MIGVNVTSNHEQVERRPKVCRGEHMGSEFDEVATMCQDTVATGGLDQLVWFTHGVVTFSVCHPDARDGGIEGFGTAGRHFRHLTATLDERTQDAVMGALIRTVVITTNGALYCYSALPKEDVFAVRQEQPPSRGVVESDHALAELVIRMRRRVSASPVHPGGGWTLRDADYEDSSVDQGRPTSVSEPPPGDERGQEVFEACLAACDSFTLQWVVHCRGEDIVSGVDYLDAPELSRFFTSITPAARRRRFRTLSKDLGRQAVEFTRVAATVLGGRLERITLDPDQGSVHYQRLGPQEYLVGITVDHDRIPYCEVRMSRLAQRLRR